jgi:small subunit ribosomal protein S6
MHLYELPIVFSQDVPVQGVSSLKARLERVLDVHGGKIISFEYWGVRSLAYKIKKQSKGRYYILKIEASPSFPSDISNYLRINESVLRYAIYKEDSLQSGLSPVMKDLQKNSEYLSSEEEKQFALAFAGQE